MASWGHRMVMDWHQAFQVANTVALLCWCSLAFLPRYTWLMNTLRYGVMTILSVVYVVVIFGLAPKMEGGGFGSLNEVKILFSSDAVIFAGWLHYLVFDLFVGMWIAERADMQKLHRILQIPILIATFMFGPVGLLLYYLVEGARRLPMNRRLPSTTL